MAQYLMLSLELGSTVSKKCPRRKLFLRQATQSDGNAVESRIRSEMKELIYLTATIYISFVLAMCWLATGACYLVLLLVS